MSKILKSGNWGVVRNGWEFSIAPVECKDKRRKHYVMLRFRAIHGKKRIAYRCGLMLTRKAAVKSWTLGLRKFADAIDAFLAKEMANA